MNFLLQSEPQGGAQALSALQELVISTARTWLGARFLHQGRGMCPKTAIGLDCLGLLMAVAVALDLRGKTGQPLSLQDATQYGWHPDGAALQARLAAQLDETTPEAMLPGDILLFRLAGNPQHLGLCTQLADGRAGLLHAYAPIGAVVEHGFSGPWPGRLCGVFRLPQAVNSHVISKQD